MSFRELRVWHAAMTLVEKVYILTHNFPTQEMYGLTSQIRRAAVLIPSNIGEGHTRAHLKEYLHHLSMAQPHCGTGNTTGDPPANLLPQVPRPILSEINSPGNRMYAPGNA
jgi:hypothetical protein